MSRAILVLGMHRSGTSSLAGALQHTGVYLGPVSEKNIHNLRGNREHPLVMRLHDRLLDENGGAWDNPPKRVEWSTESEKERDSIIDSFRDFPVWGFKDPRTLLVLDGWLRVLPCVSMVGAFRHPSLVARSLERRNGFRPEKCYRLWMEYNSILMRYFELAGFPLVCFDSPAQVYRNRLAEAISALGLEVQRTALDFFDDNLRNHTAISDKGVPQETMDLYEKLKSRSL